MTSIIALLWDDESRMAKKKKPKPFSAVKAVKEMARDRIGTPPISRVVPDRKRKSKSAQKHVPKLDELIDDF